METISDSSPPSQLLMRVLRPVDAASHTGLTFPCILLLCEMAADPAAGPEALAMRLEVTARGARSMVARLITAGCLRVVPGSGRPCRRELTPRGQSLVAALNSAAQMEEANSQGSLPPMRRQRQGIYRPIQSLTSHPDGEQT